MVTADEADRDAVVRFVFRYFPRQFDFMTGQLDAFRGQTLRLGVGGLLALTWASLGVFNAVSSAIDHAWGVERRRSFLMHRLVSFLMMVSAGAIFIVAHHPGERGPAGADQLFCGRFSNGRRGWCG